jgi:hypothetical protein
MTAIVFGGSACIKTSFAPTDSSFEETPRSDRPIVYMDRMPEGAYRSVGVIEVDAPGSADLSEIMASAAEKGQEIGCDFVIERSLHRVGALAPPKRWTVVIESEPPLRRAVAPRERRDARPSGDLALQGGAPTYYPYPVITDPPKRREFICGVYTAAAANGKPAPTKAIRNDEAATDVARVLWTKLATSPREACDDVYEVLVKDAGCARAQCAAPMILAQEYLGRCDERATAERLAEMDALRERWSKKVGKELPLTCLKALKRAAGSEDAARNYRALCLNHRASSNTELRVLGDHPEEEPANAQSLPGSKADAGD